MKVSSADYLDGHFLQWGFGKVDTFDWFNVVAQVR